MKNKNTIKSILFVLGAIIAVHSSMTAGVSITHAADGSFLCAPSQTGEGDLNICLNNIYRFSIIAASIGAVFMFIIAGYLYMFSGGNDKRVGTAKSLMSSSVGGMIILLAGMLVLKQINPDLLYIKSIRPEQIANRNWEMPDFQVGGGGTSGGGGYTGPIGTGQWKDSINTASQKYGLDPCVLDTILKKESSGGNPNAVGHDNHDRKTDPFQSNNPPKYGLNWQYSHGIGITQWTIFPYSREKWPDANTPQRKIFGKWYGVQDFLNPQLSLDLTARHMADMIKSSGNVRDSFRRYNGSGTRAENYANDAIRLYTICKGQ